MVRRLFFLLGAVLVISSLSLSISYAANAAAEPPCENVVIPGCEQCHPGADFAVSGFVDRTVACVKCHNRLFDLFGNCDHGCTPEVILGHSSVETIHGVDAVVAYPPVYNVGTNEVHSGGTVGGVCTNCHLGMADCKTCHTDVPHETHGTGLYPPPSVAVSTGDSYFNPDLSCANALCHGVLGTGFVGRPSCGNCHGDPDGPSSAHQVTNHAMLDCVACHTNAQTTLDASIHGVDRGNIPCWDCHGSEFATIFSPDDAATFMANPCERCHDGKIKMGGGTNKGCLPCHFRDPACSFSGRWNGFAGSTSWGHNLQEKTSGGKIK